MQIQFKRALVSVSNKSGLVELLSRLVSKCDLKIVSTGGTAKYLRENGFTVEDVSEVTGFPEVMGGRVKTLHPRIHMSLLARPQDFPLLEEQRLAPFDLVIVNLYPFEAAVRDMLPEAEMVEKIDVGGPSMLRAAAKNFSRVAVACDPSQYAKLEKGSTSLDERKALSAAVFKRLSEYDSHIASALNPSKGEGFPLRYGENPHQKALWMQTGLVGLHSAKLLQGKELSFNNLSDLQASLECCRLLAKPGAVFVKHGNPCGVAESNSVARAARLARDADPVSVFGGVVCLNREVDFETAEILTSIFLECVLAPRIHADAQKVFQSKKNLRVLEWPEGFEFHADFEEKKIDGGVLRQEIDRNFGNVKEWSFLGEKPDAKLTEDLVLAEKIAGSLKSNAIALVAGGASVGLGMGQVNRVDAVEQACQRWQRHHAASTDVVAASDAFFPFPDSIEILAKNGILWVLQPGGSVKDEDVFATAKRLGVNLVLTGVRHFRH